MKKMNYKILIKKMTIMKIMNKLLIMTKKKKRKMKMKRIRRKVIIMKKMKNYKMKSNNTKKELKQR